MEAISGELLISLYEFKAAGSSNPGNLIRIGLNPDTNELKMLGLNPGIEDGFWKKSSPDNLSAFIFERRFRVLSPAAADELSESQPVFWLLYDKEGNIRSFECLNYPDFDLSAYIIDPELLEQFKAANTTRKLIRDYFYSKQIFREKSLADNWLDYPNWPLSSSMQKPSVKRDLPAEATHHQKILDLGFEYDGKLDIYYNELGALVDLTEGSTIGSEYLLTHPELVGNTFYSAKYDILKEKPQEMVVPLINQITKDHSVAVICTNWRQVLNGVNEFSPLGKSIRN